MPSLKFPGTEHATEGVLPPDEVKAIEARADVDSLGDLHQRRRDLLVQLAPLAALYGNFGMWDAKRKHFLSVIMIRVKNAETVKPTEKVLDAMAHADPQYEAFLDEHYARKVEWIKLDNELTEITDRIKSRDTELRAFSAEAHLAR